MNTESRIVKYQRLEKELAPLLECIDAHGAVDQECTLGLLYDTLDLAKKLGFNRDADYYQGCIDDLER